jgi:hypothetical protein
MRIRVAFLALFVVATGTGCGVEPTPTPTTTATSPAAEAEPMDPRPRLDLVCNDATSPGATADLLGASADWTFDNGVDPVRHVVDVADLQAGVLQCQWGITDQASAGFAVLPDAEASYPEYSDWYDVDQQDLKHDELGDDSRHYCGYGYCSADVLVGELWVHVQVSRTDLPDQGDIERLFLAFAQELVAAVDRAAGDGLRDEWRMPEDAYRPVPDVCADGPIIDGLAMILDIPSLFHTGSDGYSGFSVELGERAGVDGCDLAADDGTGSFGNTSVRPGAGWALPRLAGTMDYRYGVYELVAADIGGGEALVASGSLGSAAVFELDGSLIAIAYDGYSAADLIAILPEVAALYLANAA